MGKDILIRDQIFSTYDSLYDAEKKVADYVAGHQEDVINMSVLNWHKIVLRVRLL